MESAASEGGGGTNAINWYVFNEPGGSYDKAVADCNKQAGGKYHINYVKLPTDANQQRELIVRRLAAKDEQHRPDRHGRDLDRRAGRGGLDPAVGGPATAPSPTKGKLEGPLKTVEYKGKVWAIPFTSNTQLLWYRKDKVDAPPEDFTWDEMIDDARREGDRTSRCRRASTRA